MFHVLIFFWQDDLCSGELLNSADEGQGPACTVDDQTL